MEGSKHPGLRAGCTPSIVIHLPVWCSHALLKLALHVVFNLSPPHLRRRLPLCFQTRSLTISVNNAQYPQTCNNQLCILFILLAKRSRQPLILAVSIAMEDPVDCGMLTARSFSTRSL